MILDVTECSDNKFNKHAKNVHFALNENAVRKENNGFLLIGVRKTLSKAYIQSELWG